MIEYETVLDTLRRAVSFFSSNGASKVYGANTEVGKTVVTAGLLRAAALQVRNGAAGVLQRIQFYGRAQGRSIQQDRTADRERQHFVEKHAIERQAQHGVQGAEMTRSEKESTRRLCLLTAKTPINFVSES